MDLKPDNIMIQENGHICIIDFGLSTTKRRQPRALVGTPGYCAPEASKLADGEFDNNLADVYSYGQILVDLYLCPYVSLSLFSIQPANALVRIAEIDFQGCYRSGGSRGSYDA